MIEVHILPALKDNYIYVLHTVGTSSALVIDPSEAAPVIKFLKEKNWDLEWILNTHHHHDHVGGNAELLSLFSCKIGCSVYDQGRIPGATQAFSDNTTADWQSHAFQVFNVPGHTKGAIAYYWPKQEMVFTGDTLFTLGCGRLFEGTAEELWNSLKLLAKLPEATKVYSGHEYGLNNTGFAHHALPNDPQIALFWESTRQLRRKGLPTVPSTIGQEKRLNPFLRARNLEEFTELRLLKDDFRLEEHDSLG